MCITMALFKFFNLLLENDILGYNHLILEAKTWLMDALTETGLVKIFVAMVKLLPWQLTLNCLIPLTDIV